jgi:glycerol transport system ATP-binding protein
VYATTEPAEALLLGGHVATLHEGRVTQFGPAVGVYREPVDLTSARVFSDPPINVASATKRDGRIELGEAARWAAPPALQAVADGPITVALRPHHVRPAGGPGVAVSGPVLISEISGSESVIHFGLAGGTWVSLAHGVRSHTVGSAADFSLEVERCLYFDDHGRRLAAAA